ncbi:MAG TPA: tetratricopeptide repeat protein, partial [Terriglobales bacterium]|nr:tetratricopeptide repeat protein [Terriglobales bacterium]
GASAAAAGLSTADLLPAFQAYNRGDYAQAAGAFEQLAARFPASGIPPLYLGVSNLELGRNAAAQRALLRALPLADAAARGAAAWYLAVADVRLNQSQAARPLLRDVCAQTTDPFSARACTLADRLGH